MASAPASLPAGGHPGDDRSQQVLGGGKQVVAFAGVFGGQEWVVAGDQPLAGEVEVADLGEVLGVEQRHLQRPVIGVRAAICGARSAVIHPKPVAVSGSSLSSRKASIRAEVIMPRSPTSTSPVSPNRVPMTSTMSVNATGSAVLPEKIRTATGRPDRSVRMPYSIRGKPFLPSRE